jgi:hypothetical protein
MANLHRCRLATLNNHPAPTSQLIFTTGFRPFKPDLDIYQLDAPLYTSSKAHHLKLLYDKTLSALSTPPQDTVLLPLRPLLYTLSFSSHVLMSYRLHVDTLVHLLSQIRPDFLLARVTLCAQHPACACRTTRPTVHVANWLAAIHDGESYSSIYLLLPLPCPPLNSGQALLERITTYTFPRCS